MRGCSMKREGCEVEAIGITYTINREKRSEHNPFNFFNKEQRRDQSDGYQKESPRYVLKDVNCRAKPWEILAIVGPSGAGKSSLLEVLAGKLTPQIASIFVNRKPVEKTGFNKISGYVTQKDTLFPLLTVEETLMFSAKLRLRLPPHHDHHQSQSQLISSRVKCLIQELGLSHVAGARVGDDDKVRGISGGERRRVSIGVDVIHDPKVLILDEPTSGLDSTSALQIMDMLKTMAETRGRTVILSIHQPGFRIVKLFNSILLLSNGSVLHHGTVDQLAFRLRLMGLQLPLHVNVIEFAIDSIDQFSVVVDDQEDRVGNTMKNNTENYTKYDKDGVEACQSNVLNTDFCRPRLLVVLRHMSSKIQQLITRELAADRSDQISKSSTTATAAGKVTLQQLFQQSKVVVVTDQETTVHRHVVGIDFPPNSRLQETIILTHRFSKNIFRTKELFACRTLQMLISGVVLGSIFHNLGDHNHDLLAGAEERVGLFAFILTFLLSSTIEALPIFLQEREIVMKETSCGSYRVSSYAIANAIVYLPFLLILALLFSLPLYWLVGLNGSLMAFCHFLLLIWLILYTANSVVVCFSALVPNFMVGNSVISGVMGSFFLFSGYFISKNEIPNYWKFMHYLSLFKYPFEGFLINEFSGSKKCLEYMFGACLVSDEDVLREAGFGEEMSGYWRNVLIMGSFILVYRFASYVILRCRCRCRGSSQRGTGLKEAQEAAA